MKRVFVKFDLDRLGTSRTLTHPMLLDQAIGSVAVANHETLVAKALHWAIKEVMKSITLGEKFQQSLDGDVFKCFSFVTILFMIAP